MNKMEFIKVVSANSGVNQKHTKDVIESMIETIKTTLNKGDVVQLTGFGKFETKKRKERMALNPATKKKMVVPCMTIPTFKAGTEFKKAVS